MKRKSYRKPRAGEVLLVAVALIVMIGTCIIFLSNVGNKEKLAENDSKDPGIAGIDNESGLENDPGLESGLSSGLEHEPGSEFDIKRENEGDPDFITVTGDPSVFGPSNTISVIDIASADPELLSTLNEESESHNSAAVSLVIYDGFAGEYYFYTYGYADIAEQRPVNQDTKFRIASLSKLVTAICAMILVDNGLLDLDEDISTYLGYRVRNPNFSDTPITARMLLQHTSTIHDSEAFHDSIMGRERVSTQNLLGRESSFWGVRPGTGFAYTNFGYTVLGAVCEMASGVKLDDFARTRLFHPLGIDASFFAAKLDDTSNIAVLYDSAHGVSRSVDAQIRNNRSGDLGQDQHLAQGSLMISALDYAKILAMLGNGGELLNVRVLTLESVEEIHNADVDGAGAAYRQGLASRHSFGDFVPDNGFYWHTGSAYGLFAQYIYKIGRPDGGDSERVNGTAKFGDDINRGVVVITTGASTGRADSGKINVCTHLSEFAWRGLGFAGIA